MPAEAPLISVVLPCLNEEQGIGRVIDDAWEGIKATGLEGEVVVVDNASEDRSGEIAREHGATVILEKRRGYGSAYLAGLRAARGEYIIMADSDGTYPVSDLKLFVDQLQDGRDMVIGSRFRGNIHKGAMPWLHRWIGNPVLTAVLNLFFGIRVSDAHCGLRALRRSALPRLRLHTIGMEFASEMIFQAARKKLDIGEIPIDYRPRTGESKLRTFRDGWRHLRLLLIYSPSVLYIGPGSILTLLGLAILIPLALGPIVVWGRQWGIHTMIAGGTATLLGVQLLQLGVFARTYGILYLDDSEPALERMWTRIRLEHGLLLGGGLIVGASIILILIVWEWVRSDFGPLARGHEAFFAMTLFGLGVQVVFGSFFLSILGLRKRLTLEEESAATVTEARSSSART